MNLSSRSVLLLSVLLSVALTCCASTGNFASNPTNESATGLEILKQQIFLDSKNFGPGIIDAQLGEFTSKAMANYRESMGFAANWVPNTSGISGYSTYRITSSDFDTLGQNASEPEEQATQTRMPYTSIIEMLAERFHTTPNFLRKINSRINVDSAVAGTTISVPAVSRPFSYQNYPSSYPAPPALVASSRHVTVDLREKILKIHEDGRLIAAFPITPGSTEHPAPVGEWRILGSVPFPWYRYDLGVLKKGERTEVFYNLPPGPNNPVGILWAGLNRPGIGIHGTPVPDTIGRSGSHGCIRLSNWDAATFHTLVGKGTKVSIL